MQPKKQLKVQYIGIFEEIGSFYWPKIHFLKKGHKIQAWVYPPPLFGQCPKENFFLIDTPVSEDSEVEGEEEVLVKEELVEEDAKI